METLLTILAAGTQALSAVAELGEDFITEGNAVAAKEAFFNLAGIGNMLAGFLINLFFVGVVVRGFYYPKCKRGEYFFTFILIAISIFLLIYLLGGVKLKTGFALGLFAIFSIIRYRTEQVSIREMTYLFIIIAMSAINGLVIEELSYSEMILANLLFIASIWLCESNLIINHLSYKVIKYDNIDLITPDKRKELIADLETRLGHKVLRVDVGNVDFLRDVAFLKVYYYPQRGENPMSDSTMKINEKSAF